MFADGKSNAPRGCLWTSQILEPLVWIKAFLEQTAGSLHRTFLVSSHYNRGDKIVVYVDASPWGIGGWILVNGRPLGYFADGINDMDRAVLSLSDEPGSESQQALEALAMLVALRLWLPQWKQQRVVVTVRGDNMSALSMVAKMQPKSPTLAIIARELALDIAAASYSPDFMEHVPGIANVIADTLSRKHQPAKTYQLPLLLRNVTEHSVGSRDQDWWLSLRGRQQAMGSSGATSA